MNLQGNLALHLTRVQEMLKYHLGASSNREFDGNSVHVSLTDNPSHLEAVNPVVLGQTRAKQYFIKIKKEIRLYQF